MYMLLQRRRRAKGQAGCADYFLEVPLEDLKDSDIRRMIVETFVLTSEVIENL